MKIPPTARRYAFFLSIFLGVFVFLGNTIDAASVLISSNNRTIPNKDTITNGLVGWWTFDGPKMTSSTALDSGPNGYTGTLSGFSSLSNTLAGRVGQALRFPGGSLPYIDLGTGVFNVTESSPFSGTAWIRTSTTSIQSIMSNHNAGTNPGFNFAISKNVSGKLSFGILRASEGQGRQKSTTASVNDGQWHHVAFTYSGSQTTAGILLYIDGVQAATADDFSQPPNPFVDGFAAIGSRRGTTPRYFTGDMDDVRFYNRVLTAAEISQIYRYASTTITTQSNTNLGAVGGLIGWWSFDGPSLTSSTATDMSLSGNNGRLMNITLAGSVVPGKVGQAILFNGTNQYILIASSTILAKTGSHTLTSWARPRTTSGTSSIVMKNSSGTGMFLYGLNGKWTTRVITPSGAFVATEATGSMATSTWSNVTSVYSAPRNLLSLYVNGLLVATTSVTGSAMLTTVGSSSIGADLRGSVTDFFNGTLDGVRIYSRELSNREIYNLSVLGQAWLRRP